MCAADTYHPVDARESGGGEHQRARARAHHDELADAGDLGREGVHEHRGRVRRLAPWHIKSDALDGRNALTELHALRVHIVPGVLQLPLVEAADAIGGGAQCLELRTGYYSQ